MLEWGSYPERYDLDAGAYADVAVAFYTVHPQRGPVIRDFGIRGFYIWRERREEIL